MKYGTEKAPFSLCYDTLRQTGGGPEKFITEHISRPSLLLIIVQDIKKAEYSYYKPYLQRKCVKNKANTTNAHSSSRLLLQFYPIALMSPL
jgi:hypothetical protein